MWFWFGVLNMAALGFDLYAATIPHHSYFLFFGAVNAMMAIIGVGEANAGDDE
jgi:hypothetical protein